MPLDLLLKHCISQHQSKVTQSADSSHDFSLFIRPLHVKIKLFLKKAADCSWQFDSQDKEITELANDPPLPTSAATPKKGLG